MTTTRRTPRMTQNGITLILTAVVIGAAFSTIGLDGENFVKLISRAITLSLYWLSNVVFIKFFRTRKFDVEATISEHPLALAIYLGLFVLGTAFVVILG